MKNINIKDNFIKMKHVLSVIYSSSKGYFYSFSLYAIIDSILPYVSIYYTYLIVDGLLTSVASEVMFSYVFMIITLNVILRFLLKILLYYRTYYLTELNYELDNKIAMKSYELDFAQIEDQETMKLIQQAKEGSGGNGGLKSYCEDILGNMLSSFLSITYGIILLTGIVVSKTISNPSTISRFLNSPYSSIIILVSLFIPSIVSKIVMKKDNKRSYEVMLGNIEGNRRASYYMRVSRNYVWGKDIRIFGLKDLIIEKMTDDRLSVDSNWRSYVKFRIRMVALTLLSNSVLSTIAYIFIGLKAMYGLITVGNAIAYVASITLVASGISVIVARYSKLHLYHAYLDNYFTYLNLEGKQQFGEIDYVDTESLNIEFKDVSFKYPNQDNYVLKNLNFKINSKEKIAIVGPNGAGKTTLVKLLCRLYDVTEGVIYINDIPISMYTKEALYKFYSIVFQDFKLFSYSIEDNITIGNKIDEEKLENVYKLSGIKNRIDSLDKKGKTILYQRNQEEGVDVSGGEAQKIAIARALYKNSPFVILDEPTAALDPKSEAEIYERFHTLVKDKTTIFISHRMSSTKFCDRILVLDNGQIVQNDNHLKLVNQFDGLYSRMWNAQAKYYKD